MNRSGNTGNEASENPILTNLVQGSRNSLARAITIVENNLAGRKDILQAIASHLGNAHVVGITGPPGVGKSTLIDACIPAFRGLGKSVAVLAIDPSSHVSGGAILGDRVRMAGHSEDEGVFIRSVAARGHLGGLSATTMHIINLFDAAQWDTIVVETVGTGQSEIEISELADTTVVVESPGLGDEIQAIKAGILEIADIIVVNKADLPQADLTQSDLSLSISHRHSLKTPKVLKSTATTREGIPELVNEICSHADDVMTQDRSKSTLERTRKLTARILGENVEQEFLNSKNSAVEKILKFIQSGEIESDSLAREITKNFIECATKGRLD